MTLDWHFLSSSIAVEALPTTSPSYSSCLISSQFPTMSEADASISTSDPDVSPGKATLESMPHEILVQVRGQAQLSPSLGLILCSTT